MEHPRDKRIVVIGGGIVGASLAYYLADRGAKVSLVEAQEIAGAVTATSFAWLNTSHPGPDPIAPLRSAAIKEYHQLEAQLPGLQIQWTGALSYSGSLPPSTNRVPRSRILELEPNLKHPPHYATYVAEEGALDAVAATHALVAGAQANGAQVHTQTRVLGFTREGEQVTGVETSRGIIQADIVVLAAGTGIASLADMLQVHLPITASPAIFIRYKPLPNCVCTLISSPEMEVRQNADGTLLAAEDYLDDALENQPEAIARRTAKAIQDELHGVASLEPQLARVGLRPIPADGIPIIGYLPKVGGVYVCVMHPGVTLAAIVGRLASEELIDGTPPEAFGACRPDRFFRG
ncbi:oxidoreductase [Pseudomonas fluorescens]|uniref:Oxidoreductase n=1 Tax=Pseudomonas fluorescens TaxID=294 RepID=A0A379IGQ5_PSEFL|nr:FAD-binding oxidoreductase [Pseudomonas fluorescens]AIG02047.1 oxidase [Pseudomonas fluorescens]SUD32494.1 oxidoreductase [Pseudomonas fluorescens]